MSKDNNEPAFPLASAADHQYCGMSLRDYFAAKVIQAMVANDRLIGRIESEPKNKGFILGECMASEAYTLADAMLAERAK